MICRNKLCNFFDVFVNDTSRWTVDTRQSINNSPTYFKFFCTDSALTFSTLSSVRRLALTFSTHTIFCYKHKISGELVPQLKSTLRVRRIQHTLTCLQSYQEQTKLPTEGAQKDIWTPDHWFINLGKRFWEYLKYYLFEWGFPGTFLSWVIIKL